MPEIGSLFVRIGARIDEFEAGMRKVQDRLKQAEQRFEGMRAVGQRFTAAGAKMAAAGAAMGAGLGLAVKTAADFESAMSRVGALSGATGKEFSKLRETAQKLGETTAFSASQAAEGMQFLAMAGYDTNEIIAAMPGLLNAAAAGQVDLGTTADITSNILSGFGLAASETARVADVLTKTFTSSNTTMEMLGITMKYVAPLAKSAGVSLEETAAAAGILGNAGIQADQAGTALRGMILRLIDPPKEAADALAQLGVKTTDASGKMLPLADIIAQVKQATEGMTEAQKTAIATQISGTYAASGFLALLDAGPDALRSFTGELENAGGTADRIAKEQLNNLNGQLTILKSGLEGMAISIGTTLTPYISKLASLVQGLVDRFNNLPGPIKQGIAIFAALGAIILVVGGGILIFAGMIMQGVAAIGTIITAVGGLSGALAFITGPVGIVVAAVAGLIAIGVLLYKNWDKIKSKATELWTHIVDAWEKLKKFTLNAWGAIKNAVVGAFQWMYDHNYYFQNLVDIITTAWNTIRLVTETVWNAVSVFLTNLWARIRNTAQSMWSSIYGVIKSITDRISGLFSGLVSSAYNWGKNLLGEFISGIKSMMSRLWDTLTNIGETVAGFLGFHSPTKFGPGREADKWAPNFMEMYTKGLESSLPKLQAGIERIAGAMAVNFAAPAPVTAPAGGVTTINNYSFNITVSGSTTSEQADDLLRELARRGVKF